MSESNMGEVHNNIQQGINRLGEAPIHPLIGHLEDMNFAGDVEKAEAMRDHVTASVQNVPDLGLLSTIIAEKTGEGRDLLTSALDGASDPMGELAARKADHAFQLTGEVVGTAGVLQRRRESVLEHITAIVRELKVLEAGRQAALGRAIEARDARDDAVANAEMYMRQTGGTPEQPTA